MNRWLIVFCLLMISAAMGVFMIAMSPAISGALLFLAFAAVCRLGWMAHRYPENDGGDWKP